MNIYCIHWIDQNPGDYWSGPHHYFPIKQKKIIDILDKNSLIQIPNGSRCIVGGGGLIKQTFWESIRVLKTKECRIVWWGVGERLKQRLTGGVIKMEEKPTLQLKQFNPNRELVSMWSLEPGIEWNPCASCMNKTLDYRKRATKNRIGIFQHKKVKIKNIMSHPTITNDPVAIKEAIDFINNWNTIITNSYHGMYWSYLLGKEVICIPFSSGHYNFNGKIRYTTEENAHLLAERVQGGSSDKTSDSKHEERITAHRIVAHSFFEKSMKFLD